MRREDLDGLAEAYPDCLIAAYADISVGITLRKAEGTDAPQEALEELCAEAALTFGQSDTPDFGTTPSMVAIKAVDGALFVFLRAPDELGDVLICMCRDTIPLSAFLVDAKAAIGGTA